MKKLFLNSLFFVHPLTIVYIVFGLLLNEIHALFFGYLFSFIHEIGHVIIALIFKIEIKEIVFSPLGFFASLEGVEPLPSLKKILIYLGGPATYFISYGLIYILQKYNFISIYAFKEALALNKAILLFNLIPFYPFDGGRILDSIFENFIDEFLLRILRLIINFCVIILTTFLFVTSGQLLILIFIFVSFFMQIISFKKDYKLFIMKRISLINDYKITILNHPFIIRKKNNYYLKDNVLLNEKEIINLRKNKRKHNKT